MKVLIKGAGDLATGIAYKLKICGYDILMTETAVPTTVRRTVAFSRAVYEGRAAVEGLEAVLAGGIEEAERAIAADLIPVVVDEDAVIAKAFAPDIIVDAIIAKRNLGTHIVDADFVVGVGPGFTAGVDCHCVIETQRGHYLGRTIYSGCAVPNTGIPGNIGGYSVERIIRAEAEGYFKPLRGIGDRVCEGDIVAESGGRPIRALMPGIIRGMLQEGVHVTPGMKCGDIDARCELSHCYTISDKAMAVGGGVLEAVTRYAHKHDDLGIVLLAAGAGRRYGSNKLVDNIEGRRLFEHTVSAVEDLPYRKVMVTGYDEIGEYAVHHGFEVVYNREPELGISRSLKAGLEHLRECGAVLFTVCDQPGVTRDTYLRLIRGYASGKNGLACMGQGSSELGNPCIFARKYYPELEALDGDVGGKRIILSHPDSITIVPACDSELKDIDYKE